MLMNAIHDGERVLPEQLSGIDLNLIVAFDALARERSVTRAAERLGVTQSAVSHALRRLRELLGDPLLVRSGSGMALTPHAESLVVPLRSGLITLGRALSRPAQFEPASAQRAFCLATVDLFEMLAGSPLLARVRREAPGIDINVVSASDRGLRDRLETGEVDVAIVAQMEDFRTGPADLTASGLVRRTLFRDRLVCLLRADHPALSGGGRRRTGRASKLSLESYAALSHALVSPSGEGPGIVDKVLAQHGLTRRIALRIPHFYSALAIVAKSDLILTAPAALAGMGSAEMPVVALPVPLSLPEHSVNLIWHERLSNEPGHRWLRELLTEVARAAQAATVSALATDRGTAAKR
jgi:DNA-binding transcriptional LysR family regulator